MSLIKFSIENNVASIRLNRPEVYNSFNKEMSLEVQEALDHCKNDPEVRCVLLTGEGKAFSAGQDLQEVIGDNGIETTEILQKHFNPIVERIRELEKPVVAGVNGVAAGAGANMAFVCDIVVAKESSSFIQAFSKIGLIPDTGGTFFLPRLIGWQKASALMMLGDKISAKEALDLGMIYKMYQDDEFDTAINKITSKLATMPTLALAYIKRALNHSMTNDLTTQLGIEDQLQTLASHTEDYAEGVQAFLEKRKPNFKGC